jgi:hypothetical protein
MTEAHRFHGVIVRAGHRCGYCACGWVGDGEQMPLDDWNDHRFLTLSPNDGSRA